jgi:hypothetical protein
MAHPQGSGSDSAVLARQEALYVRVLEASLAATARRANWFTPTSESRVRRCPHCFEVFLPDPESPTSTCPDCRRPGAGADGCIGGC